MSDEARVLVRKYLLEAGKLAGAVVVVAAALALLSKPLGCAVSAIVIPDAQAQAQAAVAPVKEEVGKLKDADAKLSERLATVERSATRTEVMVEMLLRDREIRPPPKVALDGGP